MHADSAIVFDEAELAKAIHKEADARSGGADHFSEGFLRYLWNQGLLFTRLTEFCHQQQKSCQSLLRGIEKLIHKIRLGLKAPGKEKFKEQFGEGVLLMDHADQLRPLQPKGGAGVHGCSRCQTQPGCACERLLTNEISRGEECDRGLLTTIRNDCKSSLTRQEIKNAICRVTL